MDPLSPLNPNGIQNQTLYYETVYKTEPTTGNNGGAASDLGSALIVGLVFLAIVFLIVSGNRRGG